MISVPKHLARAVLHSVLLILYSVSLLVGVVVGSFILFQVLPGDVARIRLGVTASEESVAQLRRELGLDRPLWERFSNHIRGLLGGKLGNSHFDGRTVSSEIRKKLPITAGIGVAGAVIALAVSYTLNILAFFLKRTALFIQLAKAGVIFPVFFTTVFGALLVATVFPGSAFFRDGYARYIFPAIVVSLYPAAVMTIVLREGVLLRIESFSFRSAQALGLRGLSLFHRAVFRPSVVAWLVAWVNQLSMIIFSAIVVEVILSLPGTGGLLLDSILRRDFPMIQGILLVNACFFIFLHCLSDAIYPRLDPRMK